MSDEYNGPIGDLKRRYDFDREVALNELYQKQLEKEFKEKLMKHLENIDASLCNLTKILEEK